MSSDAKKISIVIADDHPIVLEGIAKALDSEADFRICAKCRDGVEALRAIRLHRPDVAVLDIAMPKSSGLETLAQINADGLDTKTVFLTANATDKHILSLIEQGARGLLLEDLSVDDLAACIRSVAKGERQFPSDIVSAALEREIGRRSVYEGLERTLSTREREVMLLVADGLTNKEIARRLNLSEGTVRIHVHNIYQKTGIGTRAALIALTLTHRDLWGRDMIYEWLKGLLIVAVIFIPLERFLTLHREQKIFRRGWINDLVYLTINGQVTNFALILIVAGIIFLSSWAMPASVKNAVSAQPFLLQLIEVIVLADLGFYFMHRLFHAVPWLWKFHAIHHSIEELDWLAGARVHPIDQNSHQERIVFAGLLSRLFRSCNWYLSCDLWLAGVSGAFQYRAAARAAALARGIA